MIRFELFSNLIPIRENLPPNLNKGFIEPPYMCFGLSNEHLHVQVFLTFLWKLEGYG